MPEQGISGQAAGPAVRKPSGGAWQGIALFLVVASLQFTVMETYLNFPFPYMYPAAFIVSCLFFAGLVALVGILSKSMRAGFVAVGLAAMLEGIASRYLMLFRDAPLMLSDFASVRTAAAVAGNYDFRPDAHMVLATAVSLALMALAFFGHKAFGPVDRWFSCSGIRARLLAGAACMLFLGLSGFGIARHYSYMVGQEDLSTAYAVNSRRLVGTVYDFIGVPYINRLVEPAGYGSWEPEPDVFEPDPVEAGDMPDVVVIMNEAFSDPDDFGKSCATSDYMPFLGSFGGSSSRIGKLDVSVKAGNTANTEFEYLCGASLAYYTPRSVPYQYAISRDVPSLARYMSEMGYETWAVHPSDGDNWGRSEIYPLMGFDKCLFETQDCDGLSFKPWSDRWAEASPEDVFMMQDAELYETVLRILDKRRDDGVPRFVFVVTMQNHGGYFRKFEDLDFDVRIDEGEAGLERPDDALAMVKYLSLMKKSDQAYEGLAEALSARRDEDGFDSLTVFFGDHQPDSTAHRPFTHAAGIDEDDVDEATLRSFYVVPYGMWATYGLPDDLELGRKSVGYAGLDLFDALGRGEPAYYSFLGRMRGHVPVQSAIWTDSDGSGEASELMEEYAFQLWYRLSDPDGWPGGEG